MLLCETDVWRAIHLIVSRSQRHLPASCVDNVTETGKVVKSYICQSVVVPSDIRSQSMVSSQPFVIGDSLVGNDSLQTYPPKGFFRMFFCRYILILPSPWWDGGPYSQFWQDFHKENVLMLQSSYKNTNYVFCVFYILTILKSIFLHFTCNDVIAKLQLAAASLVLISNMKVHTRTSI